MTSSEEQQAGAALRNDLLKIADEELFTGHVLTSVAGWGPELEINLALSSMGQDEIGHARLLYGLVVGEDPAAINALVYDRAPEEFNAAPIASIYTQEWATLLVKHLLYETADTERVRLLAQCANDEVAGVAARMRYEEEFHLDYWTTWFDRTLHTAEGPARVQTALDRLWPAGGELFALKGIASPPERVAAQARWSDAVRERCAARGFVLPEAASELDGDRIRILDEMRSIYSTKPGAW